ncbi:MAG: acetolactate synthase small subunit [Bacteroidota bacterium]
METSHTFAICFSHKPGMILRIALVLERRGYTIESLFTTTEPHNPGYSEMVLTVKGDPSKLAQVTKQLAKLIDVLTVKELKKVYYAVASQVA